MARCKHALCDERCKDCMYSFKLNISGIEGNGVACGYAAVEEEIRGCPAGKHCTKFKPKRKVREYEWKW